MIFQDPISSLNPRHRVAHIVAEPAVVWRRASGAALDRLVDESLEAVGLDPVTTRNRRPAQFSGGQCQRICIARALILYPDLLICDEPVSALDVSVQAQILNLLEDLRQARQLTMLFICHDLAVVKNVSDRVAVMYLGKLCELAEPDVLLPPARPPLHRGPAPGHPGPRARRSAGPASPWWASCPRPPTRRAAAGSGLGARTRQPTVAPPRSPSCARSTPGHFVACHFPLTGPPPTRSDGPAGA